jgi:hypothetical protein
MPSHGSVRDRFFAIVLFACSFSAHADPHATIEATHPSVDATLGRNGTFYVRIAYRSDVPISLWARPYRDGREVANAMSNASARHAGSGEALGWFALTGPGDVDEIRVRAGGGNPYRQWELARTPVRLSWTAASVPDETHPPWVDELQAIEDARMRADAEQQANEPLSIGNLGFMGGFMLLVLALGVGGIVVPLWCAWHWRGGWRIAALAPLGALAHIWRRSARRDRGTAACAPDRRRFFVQRVSMRWFATA